MRRRAVSIRTLLATLLLLAIIATACTPVIAPSPAPTPSQPAIRTPAPTPLYSPTEPVPPTGTAPSPAATSIPWQEVSSPLFTLRLPAEWTTLELTERDAAAVFRRFEAENPDLARALGSPEALQGVELWAFAPPDDPRFTDNLNIRRSSLEGRRIEQMADVMGALEEQYAKFNFKITDSNVNLSINGSPAAYLRYDYEVAGPLGDPITVRGYQYLIASAEDLWILSCSAGPGSASESERTFGIISESFKAVETY